MLINEIFNTKIPYEVKVDTAIKWTAVAVINGRTIDFDAEKHHRSNDWEFYFSESKEGNTESKMGRTGSGGEFQVFSMVLECMKAVIGKHHPENIFFSAHKDKSGNKTDGRGNIYERLAKALKNEYHYERKTSAARDSFHLVKVQSSA